MTDWAGRQSAYTYDLNSQVRSLTRPNGTFRTLAYDAGGQTTNIAELGPNPSTALAFCNLKWNQAGRASMEFTAPLPHAYTPPARTNLYDADNRLINQASTGGLLAAFTYTPPASANPSRIPAASPTTRKTIATTCAHLPSREPIAKEKGDHNGPPFNPLVHPLLRD